MFIPRSMISQGIDQVRHMLMTTAHDVTIGICPSHICGDVAVIRTGRALGNGLVDVRRAVIVAAYNWGMAGHLNALNTLATTGYGHSSERAAYSAYYRTTLVVR
jgi:hypothetical protein